MSAADDVALPVDEQRPTFRRGVIFGLAAGASWLLYLHRYTWNFIRPELEREYHFTNTQLDSLFGVFNFSYAAGQIPSGVVCDLFGPHLFLAAIILLWSLLLPTFGLTGSFYGLGGLRLAFGVAQAGCYPGLTKITRTWFPLSSRTTVQGLIASLAGRSGGAMASLVMGTLLMGTLHMGWRTSLVVLAAAGVAFSILWLALFRNSPETDPGVNDAELALIRSGEVQQTEGPPVLPLRRVLRNRSLLVFVVQQFLNAGADYIYVAVMGSYFLSRNYDSAIAGLLVSLPLWGGALGGVAGGVLNDAMIRATGSRRRARSTIGFVSKLLACLCMFVAVSRGSGVAAAAWLFGVKFFADWTQPTVWGTCTDMGGRYSATVFSIVNTSGSLGMVVMPIIGGLVLDHFQTVEIVDGLEKTVTNFEPLFQLVAGMYLLAALCWFAIDSSQSLERERPAD